MKRQARKKPVAFRMRHNACGKIWIAVFESGVVRRTALCPGCDKTVNVATCKILDR